jgi:hypothetical protein
VTAFPLILVAEQLPDPGPIPAFLDGGHETYESHRAELEKLQAELEAGRSELTAPHFCGTFPAASIPD